MSVGPWQVVIIVLVALMVFGGKGLPTLGRQLGRGFRQLRRVARGDSAHTAKGTDWVATAGQVTRVAKQVRKATKLGRLL